MSELKLQIGVVCKTFEEWKLFTSSGIFEPIAVSQREAIETDMTRYFRYNFLSEGAGRRLDQIILINISEEEIEDWKERVCDSVLYNSRVPREFQYVYLTL